MRISLRPFVDPLPIPRVLQPLERCKDKTYYEVRMKEFFHQFHSQLPPTRVWGYEGQVPGPTIEVEEGECTQVLWINELPDKHFLPVDRTLHGSGHDMPEVRTVVHLHGASVEPESDGYPDAWYTNGFKKCGPRFSQKVYTYPNKQRPAMLWYHDHALGITRLNVYAGLAGLYIIRNEAERALNLPSGIYEIPLVIQDKSFNSDGSLFYPSTVDVQDPPPDFPDPSITPGFAGNTIIVNGKAWPYLEVEQRKYRFRVLNASNERFYRMKLDNGQPFIQIGSDGGLLQRPYTTDEIVIGPAERCDLVIDFSSQPAGTTITLLNTARTPFDFGAEPDPFTDGRIMQFRVIERTSEDTSTVPQFLSSIPRMDEFAATRTRDISFDVTTDRYNRFLFLLNNHDYMDGVTEDPVVGETEIWRLINPGLGVHPFHVHQIQFQVLDRIPFDTALYAQTGYIRYTGEPELPSPGERGWKDTIQAYPGYVTRLIMRFGPYTGRYVYHCHILEHEDHDMMRPFDVVARKCPPVRDECKK
ncbi:multicopper oxidase family protein [Thermoclostridium caenicola]|uniref:Spore coat protein A n=1 Tax=Thermoclostridium caenicola TaxID=659425 RepID=A0A1M6B3V5_9FIRM|nr:multicopper oxidase [Thermoclostridium caenicola]SHI43424.1 spore coat protein A [Thermoclostridium caenicola]HOL84340.1 multicopper oxidase [Thermoclostridium caenicola]HPO76348.1 multicopper oxidase [Thermoclostridium caenicola]